MQMFTDWEPAVKRINEDYYPMNVRRVFGIRQHQYVNWYPETKKYLATSYRGVISPRTYERARDDAMRVAHKRNMEKYDRVKTETIYL
jgi:hypothetical protein